MSHGITPPPGASGFAAAAGKHGAKRPPKSLGGPPVETTTSTELPEPVPPKGALEEAVADAVAQAPEKQRRIPAWLEEMEVDDLEATSPAHRPTQVHSSVLDGYDPEEEERQAAGLMGLAARTSTMIEVPPHQDPTFTDVIEGNAVPAHAPVSARDTTGSHRPVSVLPEVQAAERENARERRRAEAKGRVPKRPVSTIPNADRAVDSVAVLALILAIVGFGTLSPVAVLASYAALMRIRHGSTRGRGAATAALVLGWVGTVLMLVALAAVLWAQSAAEPIRLAFPADWGLTGLEISPVAP